MKRVNLIGVMMAFVSVMFPICAQQLPQPDSPELLAMFFNFHNRLSSALEDKKTNDVAGGAKTEEAIARLLKVDVAEVPKIASVTRGLLADLATCQNDLKSFVDQSRANGQEPDPSDLKQFEQRRLDLIDTAVQQMNHGGKLSGAQAFQQFHSVLLIAHRPFIHCRISNSVASDSP